MGNEIQLPDGYGVPLVDLQTDLLPAPTMDALDERYTGQGGELATRAYVDTTLGDHVASSIPHPTYDDIEDLATLLENGLV